METPRLVGTLLTHRARGANVAGTEEPDAGKGYVLFFHETVDDHAQHTVEHALPPHFEQ